MKLQPTPAMPQKNNAKISTSWLTFVILILLIAIAVFGIMTLKKSLEAQQSTVNAVEIKDATDFVSENPNNLEGRLTLAYSLQKDERYDEAMEQYKEVLNLDPENPAALYNMGDILRINKDYAEAEKMLKKLMEKNEYHVLGSICLAEVYTDTKKYDEAVKLMDFMIDAQPQVLDFYVMKGYTLEKKGDKAKAVASYKEALRFDPSNAQANEAIKRLTQK